MKIGHWDKNTPCWIWPGYKKKDPGGEYGLTTRGGKEILVHRLMYTTFVGIIPRGLCVLHHCDTPPCVNPAHLWIGTFADNNKDRAQKGRNGKHRKLKTHCKHGHEYTPENTYWIQPRNKEHVRRDCRTCQKGRITLFYANKKST